MGFILDSLADIGMQSNPDIKSKLARYFLEKGVKNIDDNTLEQSIATMAQQQGQMIPQGGSIDMSGGAPVGNIDLRNLPVAPFNPPASLDKVVSEQPVSEDPIAKAVGGLKATKQGDKLGGLGDFARSFGYGATGNPIDQSNISSGWASNLGGIIGQQFGNAALESALYGTTGKREIVPKAKFYNTKEEKAKTEEDIDKSARSYDRSLDLMMKRQDMIDKRAEKKQVMAETMLGKKERMKAREELRKYASDAHQVLGALKNIEAKTKKVLPDAGRGVISQTIQKGKYALGQYSADENITRYIASVNSELIPLARKLMEEKGPITEFDVARVEKGLGNANLPLEDRLAIIGDLKSKVYSALEQKRQVAGMDKDEFDKVYGSLGAGKAVSSESSGDKDFSRFWK
jgi:hypothetical protein